MKLNHFIKIKNIEETYDTAIIICMLYSLIDRIYIGRVENINELFLLVYSCTEIIALVWCIIIFILFLIGKKRKRGMIIWICLALVVCIGGAGFAISNFLHVVS